MICCTKFCFRSPLVIYFCFWPHKTYTKEPFHVGEDSARRIRMSHLDTCPTSRFHVTQKTTTQARRGRLPLSSMAEGVGHRDFFILLGKGGFGFKSTKSCIPKNRERLFF